LLTMTSGATKVGEPHMVLIMSPSSVTILPKPKSASFTGESAAGVAYRTCRRVVACCIVSCDDFMSRHTLEAVRLG
jgi:hypothetical protein